MKRILASLVLVLSLAACGGSSSEADFDCKNFTRTLRITDVFEGSACGSSAATLGLSPSLSASATVTVADGRVAWTEGGVTWTTYEGQTFLDSSCRIAVADLTTGRERSVSFSAAGATGIYSVLVPQCTAVYASQIE